MTDQRRSPRKRRRRDARENDARILDAALTLAATEGWRGLVTPRIQEATGLSPAPIRERFPERGDLAAALWRQRVCDPFFTCLGAVVAATPSPKEDKGADAAAFIAAMDPFQQHDDTMLAASELIVMARFDPVLADAVASTWQGWASPWVTPQPGALAPDQAARHGFALSIALGLLVMGRGVPTPPAPVDAQLTQLARAMASDIPATPLPSDRAQHLDLGAVFNTDDPAWDALLQATLDEVGTRGFDAATLEIIAQAAGYSRGIIQNRYPSKKAVFLDATQRMLAAAIVLNNNFIADVAGKYGGGIADAVFVRESMDRDRRLLRSISFEQIRMAWHDAEIAEALAAEVARARQETGRSASGEEAAAFDSAWHFGFAGGQGVACLADLHPEAALLPFDVVTVPLNEQT